MYMHHGRCHTEFVLPGEENDGGVKCGEDEVVNEAVLGRVQCRHRAAVGTFPWLVGLEMTIITCQPLRRASRIPDRE
jgi:hypothetical protein